MIDIVAELAAIHRETGHGKTPAGDGRTLTLRRTYPAAVEDVWDAITTAERISRWFLPISGDLRLGGRYQLEGNAGGEVLRCEPPRLLAVSWIFGEPTDSNYSEVQVTLNDAGDATDLELVHTAQVDPAMWAEYGPGAVGVGWDLGLLGLATHLAGGERVDEQAWPLSEEGRAFLHGSSAAWGEALAASGADSAQVEKAVAATSAFYAPGP